MKEYRRFKTKKQLRREGRKCRKTQRLKKWLATEACQALRLTEDILYDWDDYSPKTCFHAPKLTKALVYAIPVDQLKRYIAFSEWSDKNELYLEIQGRINGKDIPNQIIESIKNIKDDTHEFDLILSESAHNELYNNILKMLEEHNEEPPLWMQHVIYGSHYESYLSHDVSMLRVPGIEYSLSAVCCLGCAEQAQEFLRWNNRVREAIANELEVEIPVDDIICEDEIEISMNNYYWKTVSYVIYTMMPDFCYSEMNDKDIEPLADNKNIRDFIKDFGLTIIPK